MGTPREERLASNEALFRTANERMAGWEERHSAGEPELYFCECVDDECRVKVPLEHEEYERVRENSRHFFVLAGHEQPDVETVVAEHGEWVVVEKPSTVANVVDATDPRGVGPA